MSRDAPSRGESSVMEGAGAFPSPKTEHRPQLCPDGASGCSIPASLPGTWAGRALWSELSTLAV